ncbi:leucyl aminopeptidase [Pacificitalea manganoxidans]|uniref:Probable cytosol aminopeptidase n=1 Tax=Pacificitalea manganoxidans TaxID=1411902 RepID=A0A291M043_9RHOB|nr:leucyl aminopeptidase [Pacificitalea manganoxidans]ATI42280.1 leucyl aminopeptidase [Pacificitalea manganoxidans]MDR6307895.1 leucyl aminopeptidase [Pacificitalea manganoxidans]
MTATPTLTATALDLDTLATVTGRVAIFATPDGKLDTGARRINRLTKGAVERLTASDAFEKLTEGAAVDLAWPAGMAAEAVQVVKLSRRGRGAEFTVATRAAGAAIGKAAGTGAVLIVAPQQTGLADVVLGCALRSYAYTAMKSEPETEIGAITVALTDPSTLDLDAVQALVDGVYFTRDLVNAPANVLTTESFAAQLQDLSALAVEVEVLDEAQMAELGMNCLLAVGHGSESPSKTVVMQWKGGADDAAPLALIGKGVVFDTGGISLKPAAGMEAMTMDMGGAGTVAGAMKTIASRKAPANVVALVGLVENMPDGRAQRPGDIVTSMKGDTVEVINTDAEGRLVLCDVMWYAAERFKPAAMVDLATLTGAIIVALGHDNAGVFSNDDDFCGAFLKAADAEGEGAWRMPLGTGYAKLLKSDKADVKNVGGRAAGSATAAEFLHRFVPEGLPWIHLDIAGVAQPAAEPALAPKGASGWGVLALDRLVRDRYEQG